MIPLSFEDMAERSRRRRVCELEIALIRERARGVFSDPFVVLPSDPEWSKVEALYRRAECGPSWPLHLITIERAAPGSWVLRPNGRELGVCFSDRELFEAWGYP